VWSVLVKEKNSQKETFVHSKNQAPPNLSLSIRIMGLAEVEWTHNSAWADLTQHLEMDLEEKILKYKLAFKDWLHLEWSSQ
jgi:predicted kinase